MSDPWATISTGIDGPANNAASVTPNDSADLPIAARALYIGVGGNVSVDMVGGQESVVFANVPGGTVLPVRVKRVNSTGTTATTMLALW